MKGCVDLHIHTTASDGYMTAAEVVVQAKNRDLAAIAITDHDTIASISDALLIGEKYGIEVIPGVELSVKFGVEMHILGYFLKESHIQKLSGLLFKICESRKMCISKTVERLFQLGIDITLDEVLDKAKDSSIGRPHIARLLVEKGYFESVEEAFIRLLAKGRQAYFEKEIISPEEAISEIKNAGGCPILAHPLYLKDFCDLETIIRRLKNAGLEGIEAIYVDNSCEETEQLTELAIKYNMLVTGGSDFHGGFNNKIEIGIGKGSLRVPYECLGKIKKRLYLK